MNTEQILSSKSQKPIYKAIEKIIYSNLIVDAIGYSTLTCLIGVLLLNPILTHLLHIDVPIVQLLMKILDPILMILVIMMLCGFFCLLITIPIIVLINIALILLVFVRMIRLGSVTALMADLPWKRRQITLGMIWTLLSYIGVVLFFCFLAIFAIGIRAMIRGNISFPG